MIWLGALGGLVIGLLYAWSLSLSVQRIGTHSGKGSWTGLVGGAVGRWLLVAAALALAFKCSATAGLLALGGFWLARWAAILWWSQRHNEN